MRNEQSAREQAPPSLDLAFEWVKGVLYDQRDTAQVYHARIATLFTIATLVLGVGLPLGLGYVLVLL